MAQFLVAEQMPSSRHLSFARDKTQIQH